MDDGLRQTTYRRTLILLNWMYGTALKLSSLFHTVYYQKTKRSLFVRVTMPDWDYRTSHEAYRYRTDRSFFSCAIGPVGSGKSVPSLQKLEDIGREQAPSDDGIRRSRFAVVRNTIPELRSTTAVTYQQIYPPSVLGDIIWRSPAQHTIKPRDSDIEIDVNLIALDKPADVKKLLSLELTGAFFNEVREIPRAVVGRMTERVGRYGINDRPTTWSGIWSDTNPPDSDHWLYHWDQVDRPEGYAFFHQPPGVLEVIELPGGGVQITDENFPEYHGRKLTSAQVLISYKGKVQWVECPIEIIRSADRQWIVNPWMENMIALSKVSATNPLGAGSYYGRALAGKRVEEIQSYLQGVYTFVAEGRRVVPQYNPQVHSFEHLPILPDEPIHGGMDIGGGTLQPSCILFQRHPKGPLLMHREVVCYDMGVDRFGALIREALQKHFPSHVERGLIGTFWGDPAGETRDEIFETKSFDHLRRKYELTCRAAPSQDPKMRAAAIAAPCERMIDGKPGFMLNRSGCPILHKGLSGAWHYKRLQVTGDERFADKPNKNDESHPCDGCGYGCLGAGEFRALGGGTPNAPSTKGLQTSADTDFSV